MISAGKRPATGTLGPSWPPEGLAQATRLALEMAPETPATELSRVPRLPELVSGDETLTNFLSLIPDAAIAVDGEGRIVAANARAESTFGYDEEELAGKPVEVLVPERYRHSHRKHRASYLAEPRARPMGVGLDLYARRRDGSEFPVDISLAPIEGDGGLFVVAAVRDISERKARYSAEAQLAAIVQSSADAIFSMTRDGVITSWNPSAETMFGYGREVVVGRHMSQFFPEDAVFEELLDAARSGRPAPLSHDTRWPTAQGSTIDVAISVSLLGPSDEAGYSVLVRDVTVRKAAEAQLRRQALWQQAAAEVRLSLLSDAPVSTALDLLCKWAVQLLGAQAAAVVVGAPGGPGEVVGRSGDADALGALRRRGLVGPATKARCLSAGPFDIATVPLPLPSTGGPNSSSSGARSGVLAAVFPRGAPREPDEAEVLSSLASQAVVALELGHVRAQRDRLLLSADRERIARDLHDLVIQRLFGAGLRLQGALALLGNEAAAARVSSTIDDLDQTIKEIREVIFALEAPPGTGLRARVAAIVNEAAETLGFGPELSFDLQRDEEPPLQVQLEASAVLREALSNVARHAQASRVEVRVSMGDELGISVTDNGSGIGQPNHLSGLANARARAQLLGGSLELSSPEGGGTSFRWVVPLCAEP
jgi:PAS domain S-box-containing protein